MNRVRLLVEVVQAVRAMVGADYTVGMCISQEKVNDYVHKWANGQDERDWRQRGANQYPMEKFDVAVLQPLAHIKPGEFDSVRSGSRDRRRSEQEQKIA